MCLPPLFAVAMALLIAGLLLFLPWRIARRTTLVASTAFAVFLRNYTCGWVTPEKLEIFARQELRTKQN